MKITYDFHTHTTYSHGKGTIEENVATAKAKGLKGVAITDHGYSHLAFGMKRRYVAEMRQKCDEASEKYGVKVLLGIESNLRGGDGVIDVTEKDYKDFDILIAGVHRFIKYCRAEDWIRLYAQNAFCTFFKFPPTEKLIKYNTKKYVETIKNNPIDIISHVGFLCFCDPVEVAKVAADYGTYIEINTKKKHLSDEQWRKVIDTGVKFVVDSDAHNVKRIGDTAIADKLFERVEFPKDRIVNLGEELPVLRFSEYKKQHGIE